MNLNLNWHVFHIFEYLNVLQVLLAFLKEFLIKLFVIVTQVHESASSLLEKY